MFRKGQRIKELTKKVGQVPRTGVVLDIREEAVEVEWDDGRVTSLSGAYLVPDKSSKKAG
ncbi:MAG: hypothetical protein ACRDVM_01965 [Acidimicrobiia bacterium]